MKKFAIIDGNAIIHRAYHALPPLTAKDGTVINAVFGFTSMLLKVIEELKPTYIAVSFDVEGGTFRDQVYEEYKATRVKADQDLYDQIPLCYKIVEAFNIPIYTKEGYEADDVIGTIARNVEQKEEGVVTYVVTGDMDMLQLVNDEKTLVYELRRGLSDIVIFDEDKVKEKYGFGPEYIIDYKALRGDSSDNIPGVRGIGQKGATQLITQVGSIDEIYKSIDSLEEKGFKAGVIKKLMEGKENAFMSLDLATIRRDVKGLSFKLKDCATHEFDMDEVTGLFKKFEFFSLLKRIPGYKGAPTSTKKKTTKKVGSKVKVKIVEGGAVDDFVKEMQKESEFSCREVLSGKNVIDSDLVGLVFVTSNKGWYVKSDFEKVFSLFSNEKKTVVGHDVKKLTQVLLKYDVDVKCKIFDVMISSYLLQAGSRAHDLKSIVLRQLGQELPEGSSQGSLFGEDPQVMANELSLILNIKEKHENELSEVREVFEDIEMPLIPALAQMELHGVAIDTKSMTELSKEVHDTLKKLTKKIHKEAGEEFNVASSVQLREVLFEKMELPTQNIKKGKTGYSTAASELEKLRDIHPIIPHIEEYREYAKIQNTYVDVLPTLINKNTNRIHTTFNQTVAATGRLSSSDPNLQNIPIRTDLGKKIRDAFVAEPGNVLVAADYSQIELRIAASLADDKKLIEIFNNNEDVHTATAAAINDVGIGDVTRKMRYAAKEVNFGILYGMGAFGLSWRAGIPQWQAKEFIDKYFEEFSGVKEYIDETLLNARETGYVETMFGRRRYVPELQSSNHQMRNAGERMAVNMPIQGTAADIMKLAMIEVYNEVKDDEDVRLLLQVHDELVLEAKKGREKEVGEKVKHAMERVAKLDVPVVVEVHIGRRWGHLK